MYSSQAPNNNKKNLYHAIYIIIMYVQIQTVFKKNNLILIFFIFSDCFDMLILKIIIYIYLFIFIVCIILGFFNPILDIVIKVKQVNKT